MGKFDNNLSYTFFASGMRLCLVERPNRARVAQVVRTARGDWSGSCLLSGDSADTSRSGATMDICYPSFSLSTCACKFNKGDFANNPAARVPRPTFPSRRSRRRRPPLALLRGKPPDVPRTPNNVSVKAQRMLNGGRP